MLGIEGLPTFPEGVSAAEVQKRLGVPTDVLDRDGARIARYVRDGWRIEFITTKEQASGTNEFITRHALQAAVDDPPFSNRLPAPIKSLIVDPPNRERVTLVSADASEPVVSLEISGKRVSMMSFGWRDAASDSAGVRQQP
jgi:hypothetical protein